MTDPTIDTWQIVYLSYIRIPVLKAKISIQKSEIKVH